MLRLPGKKVAFAFSDPAGTNACVALAGIWQEKEGIETVLFSNRKYGGNDKGNFYLTSEVPDFKNMGVNCVFTGTSHPVSSEYFEVNCIRKAQKDNIYTISFIDHWINFKLRFTGNDDKQYYPDEIWVVDETAKKLAIKEGLPKERIFIHDNPYHTYLKIVWKPKFQGKDYLKSLGIKETGYTVLFAPDPLSLRNAKEVHGFTEDEALDHLLEILNELNQEINLIIKLHPLQPKGQLESKTRKEGRVKVYFIKEAETLELIMASDLVIGFFSNLLLEATKLGKKVLRYFPGKSEEDLLRHNSSIERVDNYQELEKVLKSIINE